MRPRKFPLANVSRALLNPGVLLGVTGFAILLGLSRRPELQYLVPIGRLYLDLLQICVLPYLLATIPLAVRTAVAGGGGGTLVLRTLVSVVVVTLLIALFGVLIPALMFYCFPSAPSSLSAIGSLAGDVTGHIDLEFILDPFLAAEKEKVAKAAAAALVSPNIFSALTANDTLRVIAFGAIFGVGMVVSERKVGQSGFDMLRHIQESCTVIFNWLNLLTPIGLICLVAPQIAATGPEVFGVLGRFLYAFLGTCALAIGISVALIAIRLRTWSAVPSILGLVMFGGGTRNMLATIPLALKTLTEYLHIRREPCELIIPVGLTILRPGTMIQFACAAAFLGEMLGRGFSAVDVLLIAALVIGASVGTLGQFGGAGLMALAAVLRPFDLSFELAFPLLLIVEPIAVMARFMVVVAVTCLITVLAAGTERPVKAGAGTEDLSGVTLEKAGA